MNVPADEAGTVTGMNSEDKQAWPDLAGRALGGSVIYANDELFAERENLIKPEEPVFRPHTFGHKGQIMDGWETRRRREPGSDAAIIRLGCGGVVRRVVVDTSYFTGNYPPEVSVEACGAEGYPSPADLAEAGWTTLVPRSPVAGDARNEFEVEPGQRATHVRLTMFPDGGVARLRVYGEPVPDPRLLPATIDLAALENGAVVTGCSNMFYSSPANLLLPGQARVMGDGWETSRRRDQANDWVEVRLACAGSVEVVELDTSHFVGNAPGWATLSGDGGDLLPRTALQPDTRHRFAVPGGPVTGQVRLDIYPDGGMARLRVLGRPTAAAREALADRFLRLLPGPQLAGLLRAGGLAAERPRPDRGPERGPGRASWTACRRRSGHCSGSSYPHYGKSFPFQELIMAITFGDNQYGKAEVRLVHITRDGDRHQIKDLNVSSALRGDFADAHLLGDNAKVVATDTQKNTVYAFAQQYGVGEIEEFGLRLGRHFVDDFEWVTGAKITIEEYGWDRIRGGRRRPRARVLPGRRRHQDHRRHHRRPFGLGGVRPHRSGRAEVDRARSSGASRGTGTPRWPRPMTASWPPRSPRAGATPAPTWTGPRATPTCAGS